MDERRLMRRKIISKILIYSIVVAGAAACQTIKNPIEIKDIQIKKEISIPEPVEEIEKENVYIPVVMSQQEEPDAEEESEPEEEYISEPKIIEVEPEIVDWDLYYLQCCVETETYGADFWSKTHVASVVMNRVNSDQFPNSIAAVVTAPNQFAYFRTNISQETIDAVNYVLENGDTAQGGLFFHSGEYSDTFNGAVYIFTDDVGHHIYK